MKQDELQEIIEQAKYMEKVKKINEDKNLLYAILTMGCQLNENDSEKICGMLEKMGYKKTDDFTKCDLAPYTAAKSAVVSYIQSWGTQKICSYPISYPVANLTIPIISSIFSNG